MKFNYVDRKLLHFLPLKERNNKVDIEKSLLSFAGAPENLTSKTLGLIHKTAETIREARKAGCPVILAFGAHTIKNCIGPLLSQFIAEGWFTHLATNGAGIIHDWEFAYQGKSSENVRENVKTGSFGMWQETGLYINLAIAAGAFHGYGYGESVGRMIHSDGIDLPSTEELLSIGARRREVPSKRAAALDLYTVMLDNQLQAGFLSIPHHFKKHSLQAAAFRLNVPFTGHPMFGHDIIYTHPANSGPAVGRTAERDFLLFADSISRIEKGVYLSVGSAVMSPMIFEKSMSMAQNLALQEGRKIEHHSLFVIDLAEMDWNWDTDGEPPPDNPAYYHRFCKTFDRMGGEMTYISADNRSFFTALYRMLSGNLP